MYFPTICIHCHYELKRVRLPSPPNTYVFKEKSECPICDGTEGELDAGYVKHKPLNKEDIPFLRFLKGKNPTPDK